VTKKAIGPRAIKLAEVANGRISPEEAEKWAENRGLAPFASKPEVPATEVMALEYWSAPMVGAWFIWRSPDAVRDQWDKAREGWTIWKRIPRRPVPHSRNRWQLKRMGPATLADVFSQAGFEKQIARTPPVRDSDALGANSLTDNPYDRMRLVLERGWLGARRSAECDQAKEEKEISPDQWKRLFGQLTNIQRIPASPAESAQLDLRVADEFFSRREQVIEAEARISKEEFEWRFWAIAQILGWLAYGSETKFRSLEEQDLLGRTYHGLRYEPDFKPDNLETKLVDILIRSGVKGFRGAEEVGVSELTRGNSIWDISDVTYVRDEIITSSGGELKQKRALFRRMASKNKLSGGQVGRRPKVTNEKTVEIVKRVRSGKWTIDYLKTFPENALAVELRYSRETAGKAREAALIILLENAGN
jgi:hypothetical protein